MNTAFALYHCIEWNAPFPRNSLLMPGIVGLAQIKAFLTCRFAGLRISAGCRLYSQLTTGAYVVKKVILILLGVVAVLLLVAGVGAGVAYHRFNQRFGLAEAAAVSHETVASAATKLRVVARPEQLTPLLLAYLPKDRMPTLPFVSALGLDFTKAIELLMPREVALLSGSDFGAGQLRLTLFVNERRGGPAIVEHLNLADVTARMPLVKWAGSHFQMPQRGVLLMDGQIPIPEEVETVVLESWSHRMEGAPLSVSGSHLLEAVLDNRNGELLTIGASIAQGLGVDWQEAMKQPPLSMAGPVVEKVQEIRMQVDPEGLDTLKCELRIGGPPDVAGLSFLINIAVAEFVAKPLKEEHGLDLKGECVWDQAQGAVIGSYRIAGLDGYLRRQINAMFPEGPKPPQAGG